MPDFALLFTLEHKRRELLEACRGLSEADLRTRPSAHEWSALEVLAHLSAADRHYLSQVGVILADPQHMFEYFDDDSWKRGNSSVNSRLVNDVLYDVAAAHDEVMHVLQNLDDEELKQTSRHPRRATFTLHDLFERYVAHDENHVQQIRQIRAAISGR